MKLAKALLPLAIVATVASASAAYAQPQTKLTSNLSKSLIQAIWCSSLLFEESFFYEEGSEDSLHYEGLAFEIGGDIDTVLLGEYALRQEEVDEIWAVFDDEAFLLAEDNEDAFLAQLTICEDNYDTLL